MTSPAPPERAAGAVPSEIASASVAGASWTLVSRVTGFGRVAVLAAVLGPTYLGNTFQATNLFPNIVFYLLTGSLFANLLVPPLMRHVDTGDREATERLARGFLGVVLPVLIAVSVVAIVAGPLILRVFATGVADPAIAADQRRVGMVLLVLLMPQVPLYGVAFTGAAVMNAHGRFALANAAPTLENLGMMATLAVSAAMYGVGRDVGSVGTGQLVLLGAGTTASVGVHAAAQWWGARRCGVTLVPRLAWHESEVRAVIDRAVPSLGYAGLNATKEFALLVVANRVAGGVVAFQVAYNFYNLAVAIGARTVANASLPTLARLERHRRPELRDELVRAVGLSLFLTVPAAFAFAGLAHPLSEGVAFGEMATSRGFDLVAAGLIALAVGVVADAVFTMATAASYALHDARAPLRAMAVRTAVTLGAMVTAVATDRPAMVVLALGAAVSLGNVAGAVPLVLHLEHLLPAGVERVWPRVARPLLAGAVMVLPALVATNALHAHTHGLSGRELGLAIAVAAGGAIYLATSAALHSPELRSFTDALRPRRH
jgi:putative peptidoglycan lipid II flippase